MESTATQTINCFGRTAGKTTALEAFYARPKSTVKVRVRKIVSKGYTRYKYHHEGNFSRMIGDYNFKQLEAMMKINFSFADSMSEADIKRVQKKWRSKL